MDEEIMAHLRALSVAVSALLATHPQPERLRPAFEHWAQTARESHPAFDAAIGTLRKAIAKA